MKKLSIKKIIKLIASIIFGLGISLLLILIITDYIKTHSKFDIYFLLVCIMYASGIAFLILWNILKTEFVYLLFFVPIICIVFGTNFNGCQDKEKSNEYYQKEEKYIELLDYLKTIEHIPTVNETSISLWEYWPFRENNLLTRLDEKTTFELIDNLPILDGATAFFPTYAAFVQAVYSEYNFSREQLLLSRTEKAYENLLERKVDIIFCLEPLDLHLKLFQDNGLKLKLIPIGREAFVFFVNKENPITNLTVENIRSIYSGNIVNWKELNGLNQDIIAFQRPKNSGSQTIFEKIMNNTNIMQPRMELVPLEMLEIINMVANYRNFPNAIGYSFLYYSTEMVKIDQIKLLSINNIFPTNLTIQNESYPFSENIYAVYVDSNNKNANIEPFMEWILSRQGQKLVSMSGYLPVNN